MTGFCHIIILVLIVPVIDHCLLSSSYETGNSKGVKIYKQDISSSFVSEKHLLRLPNSPRRMSFTRQCNKSNCFVMLRDNLRNY